MKSIDLTQPGGFPFTQDQLNYLQTAYTECLNALAQIGGSAGAGAVPVIITGMAVSGGGHTVSSGWFYYNDQLIKFTGSTVTPGAGEVPLVLITESATPLTYYDASTPNVIIEYTASLTHAPTVTDATHFPVSALVPWVAIDATLYADVAALTTELNNITAAWTSGTLGGALSISTVGGTGSITVGTVVYNKYKVIGLTFIWQLQITGCTITGSPSKIRINTPFEIYGSGGSWGNSGMKLVTSAVDFGGVPETLITQLNLDGGGGLVLDCTYASVWSSGGNNNFSINIIAEVS